MLARNLLLLSLALLATLASADYYFMTEASLGTTCDAAARLEFAGQVLPSNCTARAGTSPVSYMIWATLTGGNLTGKTCSDSTCALDCKPGANIAPEGECFRESSTSTTSIRRRWSTSMVSTTAPAGKQLYVVYSYDGAGCDPTKFSLSSGAYFAEGVCSRPNAEYSYTSHTVTGNVLTLRACDVDSTCKANNCTVQNTTLNSCVALNDGSGVTKSYYAFVATSAPAAPPTWITASPAVFSPSPLGVPTPGSTSPKPASAPANAAPLLVLTLAAALALF